MITSPKASFKLQTNLFCFLNWIFHTDCLHCHLQVIRLDLLHPDITALYRSICIGYCGNNVDVSTCARDAAFQRKIMTIGKVLLHHLAV